MFKRDDTTLPLKSLKSCARALSLSTEELNRICESVDKYYRPFSKKKSNGNLRVIDNPLDPLKAVQRRVNRRLLVPLLKSEISYGGIKGRSHITAACCHTKKPSLCSTDISSFFPSISHKSVYKLFVELGCSPQVARCLTRLLTYEGRVPQGSPASTTLANLFMTRFDLELDARSKTYGCSATRLIDDIVISGSLKGAREVLENAIRDLHRLGLKIARNKTKVELSTGPQVVHNLNVNSKVSLPKKDYRKKVRDQVRRVVKFGATTKELNSLKGKINYVRSLHPREGNALLAELARASIIEK